VRERERDKGRESGRAPPRPRLRAIFRFKSCAPAGGSGFEWWERLLFTRLEFYGKLLKATF